MSEKNERRPFFGVVRVALASPLPSSLLLMSSLKRRRALSDASSGGPSASRQLVEALQAAQDNPNAPRPKRRAAESAAAVVADAAGHEYVQRYPCT